MSRSTQRNKPSFFKRLSRSWVTYLVILVLLLAVGYYIKNRNSTPTGNVPTTPFDTSTPKQKQQDAAINASNKQQAVDKGAAQPTPAAMNNASQSIDLSGKQESNGTVTVFTKLYGYSDGSCSLTVTNGSATANQTATVIYAPDYSSCAGFSVPITGLGTGDWNISLKVDSNSTSTKKNISFRVM